jgi:hypothetical protein
MMIDDDGAKGDNGHSPYLARDYSIEREPRSRCTRLWQQSKNVVVSNKIEATPLKWVGYRVRFILSTDMFMKGGSEGEHQGRIQISMLNVYGISLNHTASTGHTFQDVLIGSMLCSSSW